MTMKGENNADLVSTFEGVSIHRLVKSVGKVNCLDIS